MRAFGIVVVTCVALVLASCGGGGGGGDDSSSTLNVSGTWVGTASDFTCGNGGARVTLNQSGSNITGTWLIQLPYCADNAGSVHATLSGRTITGTLSSSMFACTWDLSITVSADGQEATGTYRSRSGCGTAGNLNVHR